MLRTRAADEPQYDLVIRNGRIVDGTGNPWFAGEVAVAGGRIVAVGRVPPGKATREIDAAGLVVAPGFIDMHSHSDTVLLEDGLAQSKIRQGVTTDVLGEGSSAGPRLGKLSPLSLLVGSKGLLATDDHNVKFTLLPEDKFRDVAQDRSQRLPASRGHYHDWLHHARGGQPAFAHFG